MIVEHWLLRGTRLLSISYSTVKKTLTLVAVARASLLKGKYDEAGLLYKKTHMIYEKRCGPDHPDIAPCLINWAGLLEIQV